MLFRSKKAHRLAAQQLEDRITPTTFLVDSLADGAPTADGELTLREAIEASTTNAASGDAPAGEATLDTIMFSPELLGGTINIIPAQGEFVLNGGGDLTITSPDTLPSGIVISGQNAVRVFNVSSADAVTLENLTVTKGDSGAKNGGGLFNTGTNTTLMNVRLTGNKASGVGADGGGIANKGTLVLDNTEVTNNIAANGDGGGIYNDGGILTIQNGSHVSGNTSILIGHSGGGLHITGAASIVTITDSTFAGNTADGSADGGAIGQNDGMLNIRRSTFSGNVADLDGGGIDVQGGTLNIVNSTLTGNIAGQDGGGIQVVNGTATLTQTTIARNGAISNGGGVFRVSGTATLNNSIVALNQAGTDDDIGGAVTTNKTFVGTADGDPRLGPLQDNGGPTFTLAPLAGSPVIDAGDNNRASDDGTATGTPLTTDQRGMGFDRIVNGTVDQGAVEFSTPTPTLVPAPTVPPTFLVNSLIDGAPAKDGQLTLREAIQAANTNTAVGDAPAGTTGLDVITFDSGLLGGTILLTAGELTLTGGGDVRIYGPATTPDGIVISGQNAVRVFNVTNTANAVTLENLTVTGGNSGMGNDGGGLVNNGTNTTLMNVRLTGNIGDLDGGGILNKGTLVLDNTEVSNNTADDDGGGIYNDGGILTVQNDSHISGNTADDDGGGIFNNDGILTIQNGSHVSGNTAMIDDGGGLFITGAASMVTITDSTFAGNTAPVSGNGGAIRQNSGILNIRRSTFSGNVADDFGGGIESLGGTLNIVNSTLTGNIAGQDGGGIQVANGTVTLTQTTIARNGAIGNGGGVFRVSGTATLNNSIVALNQAGTDDDIGGAVTTNKTFVGTADGDPRLGSLQDNGGPTFTLAPLAGSPVIDNGNNNRATEDGSIGGTPLTTDQRGGIRILGGTVDQGAVESTIAPMITFPSDPGTYIEGTTPIIIDAAATVTDPDSLNFDQVMLTVEISNNSTPNDVLGIRNEGTGAGQIGVTGNNITFGGVTIGSFTGGTMGEPLVVTFNTNATPAAVQALTRNLTFSTPPSAPTIAPRTIRAVVIDGNEGTSNPAQQTINVTPAPVTVTVEQATDQADPTNALPVLFTVVFSEPVTGFEDTDVMIGGTTTGGTASVTESGPMDGTTYTVEVSGVTGQGTVVVSVPAGAAMDTAGNLNEASTSTDNTVLFDNQAPSVTLEQATGQDDPTNSLPVLFTVVFSEPVTGFEASDVDLSASTLDGNLTATVTESGPMDGTTYTLEVTGIAGSGDVVASVPAGAAMDATTNLNEASTSTDNTVSFDRDAPTVTVEQATGQDDPTNALPVLFTVVFSEPVTGFDSADVMIGGTATGGTASVTESGPMDGTTYTVEISGLTSQGTVVVTIPAGAAMDTAGNTSEASTSMDNEVTFQTLVGQNTVEQFGVGLGVGGGGTVSVRNTDSTEAYTVNAFDTVPGGVRTAMADVTGDDIPDLIVGVGPGAVPQVRIFDGATQTLIQTIDAFEASFLGGVFVAAGDIDGDGLADVIITPDEGGGPRVRIFAGGPFTQIADFFGIEDPNFRGGARASVADVDGDGRFDLLVAAGFGGGPRLAVFDGPSVASGASSPTKPFPDFFVFEQTLRNGVFVAGGDINGDGFGDVIAAGGPGGGPRIFALSGQDLVSSGGSSQVQVANFFAGDVNNRGGIRIVAKDLDGDENADLVAAAGTDASPRVTAYAGSTIAPDGTPPELFSFLAGPADFLGGVFVG